MQAKSRHLRESWGVCKLQSVPWQSWHSGSHVCVCVTHWLRAPPPPRARAPLHTHRLVSTALRTAVRRGKEARVVSPHAKQSLQQAQRNVLKKKKESRRAILFPFFPKHHKEVQRAAEPEQDASLFDDVIHRVFQEGQWVLNLKSEAPSDVLHLI